MSESALPPRCFASNIYIYEPVEKVDSRSFTAILVCLISNLLFTLLKLSKCTSNYCISMFIDNLNGPSTKTITNSVFLLFFIICHWQCNLWGRSLDLGQFDQKI
jgi:hypothetical protein